MQVDLLQQTGPSPLWNGARRASSDVCPELRSTGCGRHRVSVVISSQTGGSGAPETTDDQPCSGGPSRELHNIIGEVGQSHCDRGSCPWRSRMREIVWSLIGGGTSVEARW